MRRAALSRYALNHHGSTTIKDRTNPVMLSLGGGERDPDTVEKPWRYGRDSAAYKSVRRRP